MTVANTLAYYDTAIRMAVKCFIAHVNNVDFFICFPSMAGAYPILTF